MSSARRNDLFLRSVDFTRLDGVAFALTLTVRTCPPSHAEWERMRRALLERLRRLGMIRLHWLTEWQPRARHGTGPAPHLHAVVFFDRDALLRHAPAYCVIDLTAQAIKRAWLEIAAGCDVLHGSQHVELVSHIQGWFGYLAKHGARGVFHLQRQAGLPDGWQKTGRMWGKSGEWVTSEQEMQITETAFFALRRFVRRWTLEKARRDLKQVKGGPEAHRKAAERVRYLERLPRRHSVKNISRIIPISEWCSSDEVSRWVLAMCDPSEVMHPETGEILVQWDLRDGEERGRQGVHRTLAPAP